jgi:hypothetical protein
MHCPQCGQQQTPGEVRFCSRCGFPLGGVSELIAHGGALPNYNPLEAQKPSPRRKGVQQGATLIMLGIITTILFGILNNYLGTPEFLVALSAVIGFVGGPLRVLFALIFEEGAPRHPVIVQTYVPPHTGTSFGAPVHHTALPLAQAPPVPVYRPQHHTAEMVRPASVTEGTTRLLEKDKEHHER